MKRYSKQRAIVLDTLRGTDAHPTADWIYSKVRELMPNISLGTVYRNLDQMAENGTIRRIYDHGHIRYDGNTGRHDHFRCLQCGRLFDVKIPFNNLAKQIETIDKFHVTEFTIELSGYCPDCKSN